MLNVFKNALTIERKPVNNIYSFKKDRENSISSFVSEIIEIKQNELDEKLRKSLREWVLKNAFPKELKALEIIRKKHIHKCVLDTLEQDFNLIEVKGKDITQKEYNLLKEVLSWFIKWYVV